MPASTTWLFAEPIVLLDKGEYDQGREERDFLSCDEQ